MRPGGAYLAKARSDGSDRLIEADEPLAGLQLRSGGELPGVIATPALLELVRKARHYGLRLARSIQARDDNEIITAWIEVVPQDGDGCEIGLANWQAIPLPPEDIAEAARLRADIDRQTSEFTGWLDPHQRILSVDATAPELAELVGQMREGAGKPWTDFVDVEGSQHQQPLHWRLLDGAKVRIAGSVREWRASLVPLGGPEPGSSGFELYLASTQPLQEDAPSTVPLPEPTGQGAAIGRDVAPVLRQPIARIIANAETIRTRLAGPLTEEYSSYAADIAAAGQHLLALIDDLADLEVVEAEEFSTAPDEIDLADVARRALGILAVRAQERGIMIDPPQQGESLPAIGEFRRVLQVLLNLIGNAIRYAPEGSQILVRVSRDDGRVCVSVADQGQGLSAAQQAKVFEKFERLGRSGDGGSGLGLYISRRLARAMRGDLTVESSPGQGARFTLALPAGE